MGFGLAFPSLMALAMSGASENDSGLASGLVMTTQQVGGALGLSVLASLSASQTNVLLAASLGQPEALTQGYRLSFAIGAGLVLVALVVAAKVLRPHKVAEERSLLALRREADIGDRLAHPNLVRLLRWTDVPPRPHLVLELVSAPSVEDHLESVGPVRVPETCLLGIRMLAALRYMHAEGVLHLDVKPANVTMGDPPRLLDLSLVSAAEHTRLVGDAARDAEGRVGESRTASGEEQSGRQAENAPRAVMSRPATPAPARPLAGSAAPDPLPCGRRGAGA